MKRDMRKYILRKLVELIFTLLFVTLLSFLLMRLSSVDPATAYAKRMIGNPTAEQIEKIRIQLGFDKPLLALQIHACYNLAQCVSVCSSYWLCPVPEREPERSGICYLYRAVIGYYHTNFKCHELYGQHFSNEISSRGIVRRIG